MMIKQTVSALAGAMLALITLLSSGCTEAAQPANPGGIQVSGQGTLEVVPDMGRVSLHVRQEGTDAAGITKALNQTMADLIAMARELGIDENEITATALSINPRYRRRGDETVTDGVVATRSMTVVLRELDRFADLLNRALALGANNVDPIQLDTSRREALEDEALTLAMEDAKAEAARVANGFAVTLGSVTSVQVGGHSPRPEAMRAMSYADSAPSFSPGVIQISRHLNATFAILPGI